MTPMLKPLVLAATAVAVLAAPAFAAQAPRLPAGPAPPPTPAAAFQALPDWSGDWVADKPGALAADQPVYKADWAQKVAEARKAVAAGKLKDPIATCGLPAGTPRMLAVSDIHEWIVRPEGVWHAVEYGGTTRRIYMDGRPHLTGDDIFPTYTGDAVGRWEGETLVIDTLGLTDDTWLDGRALLHSTSLHVVERVRKTGPDRLQVTATIEDPVAFEKPWTVTRTFKRLPKGSYIRDWACKVVRTSKD